MQKSLLFFPKSNKIVNMATRVRRLECMSRDASPSEIQGVGSWLGLHMCRDTLTDIRHALYKAPGNKLWVLSCVMDACMKASKEAAREVGGGLMPEFLRARWKDLAMFTKAPELVSHWGDAGLVPRSACADFVTAVYQTVPCDVCGAAVTYGIPAAEHAASHKRFTAAGDGSLPTAGLLFKENGDREEVVHRWGRFAAADLTAAKAREAPIVPTSPVPLSRKTPCVLCGDVIPVVLHDKSGPGSILVAAEPIVFLDTNPNSSTQPAHVDCVDMKSGGVGVGVGVGLGVGLGVGSGLHGAHGTLGGGGSRRVVHDLVHAAKH